MRRAALRRVESTSGAIITLSARSMSMRASDLALLLQLTTNRSMLLRCTANTITQRDLRFPSAHVTNKNTT